MDKKEFKSKVERQMLHSDDFVGSLDFELSFSKTDHAEERQKRHSSDITNEEISATIEEVSETIKERVLKGQLTPGDELVVRDQVYNLNLVTKLKKRSGSNYQLLIETVMLSCNFKPNSGQEVIDIFNS